MKQFVKNIKYLLDLGLTEQEIVELADKVTVIDINEVLEKPFKLEMGKDYINKRINQIVIDRVDAYNNNGFLSGKFKAHLHCNNPYIWREATESEVIEAFEKELVRRYGENWKDVKVKECMYLNNGEALNSEILNIDIAKTLHGWEVWNKNACLFYKGKWAEALEEYPTIELRGLDKNCQWCAMDGDREVHIFESKPNKDNEFNCWYDRTGDELNCKYLDQSQFTELKKLNWKDSLHKIKHV